MTRRDIERLQDILDACAAIEQHLTRGDLADGLVFDAIRVRLIEVGEAVNSIDPSILAREPVIQWNWITGMRNRLAHRYFDTDHAIVEATINNDLPKMTSAVERLIATTLGHEPPSPSE